MLEHFKGDEIFVKKILDYKQQALYNQKMILTPFLNPHEQDIVNKVVGTNELKVESYGGFINAENKRVIICPDFYEIEDQDYQIVLVEIVYNQQFGTLKHKDILGALMNLGIKRDCIGDIDDNEHLYFTCTAQSFPYIQDYLKQIKKSKIKLKQIYEKVEIQHQYTAKTFFLSSMRVDKVVSTLYKISRQEASESIRAGFVKVNHKVVEEVNFLCHNNDIISFKRHGRVKIVDEEKTSKQGNRVVTGYFYK
ncbi:MAG: YlmH/Sll1252 family protein [Coprobacillus sp.]